MLFCFLLRARDGFGDGEAAVSLMVIMTMIPLMAMMVIMKVGWWPWWWWWS